MRMFSPAGQALTNHSYQLALAGPLAQSENSPLSVPLSADNTQRSQEAPGQSPLDSPLNPVSRQGANAQSPLDPPPTATEVLVEPTATALPTDTALPTETALPTDTALPTEAPTLAETPSATVVLTNTLVPTDTLEPTVAPTPLLPDATELPSEPPANGTTSEEQVDATSRSLAGGVGPGLAVNPQPDIETPIITQSELDYGAFNINPLDALLTMESLILSLLCLIFISINGLGLTALIVTMLYIRSRREQPYS